MSPSPIWFPLILILYGEGSYCHNTRKCSRVILYLYLLTVIVTSHMEDVTTSYLVAYGLMVIGYIYCISVSERLAGKIMFCFMIIAMSYICSAVIFQTMKYDIVVEGFSLLSNSSYVYREGSLIALSMCSFLTLEEHRANLRENILSLVATILWFL